MNARRRLLVGVLAVVLVLGACGSADDSGSGASSDAGSATTVVERVRPPGLEEVREVEVRIVEGPDGEPIVICVLVAESDDERQRGLMEVTDLGGYDGMLFVYPTDSEGGFWMKDTLLPLSIAYLDADGAVVSTADMEPCPDGTACPTYAAAGPYRMALEVEQGGLAPLALTDGSDARLEIAGPCPSATG